MPSVESTHWGWSHSPLHANCARLCGSDTCLMILGRLPEGLQVGQAWTPSSFREEMGCVPKAATQGTHLHDADEQVHLQVPAGPAAAAPIPPQRHPNFDLGACVFRTDL